MLRFGKYLSWLLYPLVLVVALARCTSNEVNTGWEVVSSPPDFNAHHSFGFSVNGKGYLVTGDTGVPRKDFFQYDPVTDTWTKLDDYPGPARSYGIGVFHDGKAYLGFGYDKSNQRLNDLWVFDPTDTSWTRLTDCPCIGRSHPTLVANQGKLFMGMGNTDSNLKDWWEYDVATDTWTQRADFPSHERHHPYQFALNNYVFAGFGHGDHGIFNDWYRYDPASDTWEPMASLPGEGRVAGTQFDYNGFGYVLSGDGSDHDAMDRGEFWRYNPAMNTWTELSPHPGNSRWAPASFIIDNYLYLFGGKVNSKNGSTFQTISYRFKLN